MAKKYIRIWQALNIIERIQKKEKKHYGITAVFLALNTAKDYIKNLPAADVQEAKHGEWIKFKEDEDSCYVHMRCSICSANWVDPSHADHFHYCPNCGAKMDTQNGGKHSESCCLR